MALKSSSTLKQPQCCDFRPFLNPFQAGQTFEIINQQVFADPSTSGTHQQTLARELIGTQPQPLLSFSRLSPGHLTPWPGAGGQ